MPHMLPLLAASVVTVTIAGSASASITTIALPDIGTFEGYRATNQGQTFSGTGFVGVYSNGDFAHLFGLEGEYSRTTAQVDVSAFKGKTINSAVLSFYIEENYSPNNHFSVSGSTGDGALGYSFFPQGFGNYGNIGGYTGVNGFTSVDITSFVSQASYLNADWLDLFLRADNGGDWTYTYQPELYSADQAMVRLIVDYEGGAEAPEPSSWATMLVGFGMTGAIIRRRQSLRNSKLRDLRAGA